MPDVLTIHDLSLLRQPLSHPPARLLTAPLMVAAVRRAVAIIVPSEATARDVTRTLRVARRRIVVIPEAPASVSPLAPDEAEERLRRRGLAPRRYVLSLGSIDGRKYHPRLVRAFELLAAREPDLMLVIAGAPERGAADLARAVAASAVGERIKVVGYVDPVERGARPAHLALTPHWTLVPRPPAG